MAVAHSKQTHHPPPHREGTEDRGQRTEREHTHTETRKTEKRREARGSAWRVRYLYRLSSAGWVSFARAFLLGRLGIVTCWL